MSKHRTIANPFEPDQASAGWTLASQYDSATRITMILATPPGGWPTYYGVIWSNGGGDIGWDEEDKIPPLVRGRAKSLAKRLLGVPMKRRKIKKNPSREDVRRAVSAVVRHTSEAWDAAFPHIKSFAKGGASLAFKATKATAKFTARHSAPLIQRGAVALGEFGRRKNPSPQQETPSFIRHVVAGILRGQMTKTGKNPTRADVSRAFAIAVGGAQKHGYLKPGTVTLTRKGVGKETYHRSHVETEDLYEAILEHVRKGEPRRENPPRVTTKTVKKGTKFSHAMIARIAEYLSEAPPGKMQPPSPPPLIAQISAHAGGVDGVARGARANPSRRRRRRSGR